MPRDNFLHSLVEYALYFHFSFIVSWKQGHGFIQTLEYYFKIQYNHVHYCIVMKQNVEQRVDVYCKLKYSY